MAHFQDDTILFSASEVQATFGDGYTWQKKKKNNNDDNNSNDDDDDDDNSNVNVNVNLSVTAHRGTPLGDEIWIVECSSETDHLTDQSCVSTDRIVRFIFSSPEKDWRQNQTYIWKLDSAWMSNVSESPSLLSSSLSSDSSSSSDVSWLHWNVESYINSSIQVTETNTIWTCDEVTFHFRPLLRDVVSQSQNSPGYPVLIKEEQLVLKNVKIGLHLLSKTKNDYTLFHSPCPGDSLKCSVIDGRQVQNVMESTNSVVDSTLPIEWRVTIFLTVAVLVVSCWCWCWLWQPYQRHKLYRQLSPDEDLKLTVEYTNQGTTPQSTVWGVVNETG